MKKAISVILISTTSFSFISCGNKTTPGAPRIATGGINVVNSQSATSIFNKAKSLEKAGKTKKAIAAYGTVAGQYPLSSVAAEARFNQATLLYKQGELVKSFDTYQIFIEKHNSSKLYSQAVERQYEVAIAAAQGDIKHNFIGIKSKLSIENCDRMLNKCKSNAPFSRLAPKSQFALGKLYQDRGDAVNAIIGYKKVYTEYPEHELTPEARYRAGSLILKERENGNRNQAATDEAKNIFLDLIQEHPNHPRAKDAKAKLKTLGSSNVKRNFDTAEFYRNKGQNKAAIIYYKEVIKLSPSGSLHNQAKQRIAELSK